MRAGNPEFLHLLPACLPACLPGRRTDNLNLIVVVPDALPSGIER
jgi:hypothetical protein